MLNIMATVYVFKLESEKYYITEFKNDIIRPIIKYITDSDSNKRDLLLIQNLKIIIPSFEWIEKFPIIQIFEKLSNQNLENTFIRYIKICGIDNVRCDLYKNIVYSEIDIKNIQNKLDKSMEPIPDQIKSIDIEINDLKSIYDLITANNLIINKYISYSDNNLRLELLTKTGKCSIYEYPKIQKFRDIVQRNIFTINTLQPFFITYCLDGLNDDYLDSTDMLDFIVSVLEKYFSNHKILEEIANALLLQTQTKQMISKYGTLEEINDKLANMFQKKMILLYDL